MSGRVISAFTRQNVLALHAAAQGDGRGIDIVDGLSQDMTGLSSRSNITFKARSVRRSIATSALALAYQSRACVLQLLRSC